MSAADGGYDAVAAELAVAVVDDDIPAVVIEPQETLAAVEGGSAQYSVALATRPSGDVTVTIAGHGGTDVTLSDESLVFTSEDWDTPQAVTLSAAHDDDAFDESVVLVLSGADGGYDEVAAELAVTIADDDTPAIVIEPENGLSAVEGASGAYSVRLDTRPGGDVTVTVSGHGGTDVTLSDESLVFTSEDWDIAQEVTVTVLADDDAFDEDPVVLVHSAAGGGYDEVTAALVVAFKDVAGIVVEPEGGAERGRGGQRRLFGEAGHPAHRRRQRRGRFVDSVRGPLVWVGSCGLRSPPTTGTSPRRSPSAAAKTPTMTTRSTSCALPPPAANTTR